LLDVETNGQLIFGIDDWCIRCNLYRGGAPEGIGRS
jgi:hypothetical protein